MSEGAVQCPCGRYIANASEYKMIFLKKELNEIDILCPNDNCYLRELGYIRFEMKEGKPVFKEATFYPPFVTWNVSQLGKENANKHLKDMLREIVTKHITWDLLVKPETK